MIVKGLTASELKMAFDNILELYGNNVYMRAVMYHKPYDSFYAKGKYNQRKFNVRAFPTYSGALGSIYITRNNRKRKVKACCAHVFRDFFREIYKINPKARIKTAYFTYKSKEDFEQNYIQVMCRFYSFGTACFCVGEEICGNR